jgi:hypothetical protein
VQNGTPRGHRARRPVPALPTATSQHTVEVTICAGTLTSLPPPLPPTPPQISVVQFLLTKDADPNEADKSGNTPLHIAARAGFKDVVKALLAGGAKPSSNRAGKSPQNLAMDPETAGWIEAAAT